MSPGFRLVKRPLTSDGEPRYMGWFFSREEADRYLAEYEKRLGCEPGCDHGFGAGSGYRVEPLDPSEDLDEDLVTQERDDR